MTKHNVRRILIAFVCAFAGISLLLLVSGHRLLIWETKVEPGNTYILAEWGNLGEAQQAQLVCRYFTGRSIKPIVYWHSPNGIMGKDQCPFVVGDEAL
jgi:hypothetical protein